MNKIIGITIGDIQGIGIRILIDRWKKNQINNFILFSDIKLINNIIKQNKIYDKVNIINKYNKINFIKKKFNIFTYKSFSLENNTYQSLKYGYKFCKDNVCIGLITLPLRKDLIQKNIDKKFIGQTEFFQKIDKKSYSNMILYHDKIIISPLTTHIKLKNVPKVISNKKLIYNQIYNLYNTLIIDLNIKKPKIIISGLNPHAGENGFLGKEENQSLTPMINKLKKRGIIIDGPFSADSILIKKNLKKYDCFIFLYHDQALIPFKYISQFSGVNYTGNLSIIRTSPDHGTAYNLVGKKNVSYTSLINCFKLIKKINKNRILNAKS